MNFQSSATETPTEFLENFIRLSVAAQSIRAPGIKD